MTGRHVGAFLHRCESVAETKAWLDAGERTVTKRDVDGRTATFAKR
jgi:hypothetical protein